MSMSWMDWGELKELLALADTLLDETIDACSGPPPQYDEYVAQLAQFHDWVEWMKPADEPRSTGVRALKGM